MKQELVRTKSKISSLKREMSSIQQLHLAQQQVHSQLSASAIISSHQEPKHHRHYLHPSNPRSSSPIFLYTKENLDDQNRHRRQQITLNMKDLSISSNDEPLSPPPFGVTNTSSSTQTPPLKKTLMPNEQQQTNRLVGSTISSTHADSATSPSDEQLRLYLTETLQREKDSDV